MEECVWIGNYMFYLCYFMLDFLVFCWVIFDRVFELWIFDEFGVRIADFAVSV